MMSKKKLAVFASGNGSNFEAIVRACADGKLNAEVVLLVCDKPGAYCCDRAQRLGIETFAISPRDFQSKASYESAIVDMLNKYHVDLICLAGYMRIITDVLLGAFPNRIINIHPSLLPAFKGAHAIQDAYDYGVKVFGVTVHFVNEDLDGGRIIAQRALEYHDRDIEQLESNIHAIEHVLYVEAIAKVLSGDGCILTD